MENLDAILPFRLQVLLILIILFSSCENDEGMIISQTEDSSLISLHKRPGMVFLDIHPSKNTQYEIWCEMASNAHESHRFLLHGTKLKNHDVRYSIMCTTSQEIIEHSRFVINITGEDGFKKKLVYSFKDANAN